MLHRALIPDLHSVLCYVISFSLAAGKCMFNILNFHSLLPPNVAWLSTMIFFFLLGLFKKSGFIHLCCSLGHDISNCVVWKFRCFWDKTALSSSYFCKKGEGREMNRNPIIFLSTCWALALVQEGIWSITIFICFWAVALFLTGKNVIVSCGKKTF